MRTRRPLAAFFVLTLAFFAIAAGVSASAQTIIHIPADQPTIQAGIDAAHNGDTVLVSPGTYYENIDFKGKAITVTSSAGAAVTTIDGGGNGPAVHIQDLGASLCGSLQSHHPARRQFRNLLPQYRHL
jgi:hypothetical protein